MSVVDDIGRAIMREKQRLSRFIGGPVEGPVTQPSRRFSEKEINALVRVEVSEYGEAVYELERYACSHGGESPSDRIGPIMLASVPIYTVRNLPSPGWRVVSI